MVKTKGAAELLVKRRLGVLKDLIREYQLKVSIQRVPSSNNKADEMTRVKKNWLQNPCADVTATVNDVKTKLMGVERSWYLARMIKTDVRKEEVKQVVKEREKCQSIDPAPVTHDGGELGDGRVWTGLAVDVTHYMNIPYLSVVDCGPERFVIWRR